MGRIGILIPTCCYLTVILLTSFFHLGVSTGDTELEQKALLKEAAKMKFLLYTRSNPLEGTHFVLTNLHHLRNSSFDITKPTKILVHGWKSSWSSPFNILIKNAFLLQHDVNVIVISWDYLSMESYFYAKEHIETIGKVVALMIDKLCTENRMQIKDVHVIGHSLGAHVSGITGLHTKVGKIPRVTGLDPAGPFISFEDNPSRLSRESADFVDVIHTAAWILGTHNEIGHVDFFPNGGTPIQPGCGFDIEAMRSHGRSFWLFASSILHPKTLIAVQCSSWADFKSGSCRNNHTAEMGEHVSRSARGTYFLRTSNAVPYGLGNSTKYFE